MVYGLKVYHSDITFNEVMYTQQSPVETYKLLDLIFNLCSNKNHPMGNM